MHRLSVLFAAVLVCLGTLAMADQILGIAWPWGAYRIDLSTATVQPIGSGSHTGLNSMARDLEGRFLSVGTGGILVSINPATGATTEIATLTAGGAAPVVPSLAVSPLGTLYAINREFPDTLYTVNMSSGNMTKVGSVGAGFTIQGLAFSPQGILYGWDIGQGLLTIDTTTGAATDVNPSLGAPVGIQCLTFSPTGVLYGAQYALYTIDTATGMPAATAVQGLLDIRGIDFIVPRTFRLTISPVEGGVRICLPTALTQTYQIEHRAGYGPGTDWAPLGDPFLGTGGDVCLTYEITNDIQLYRAFTTGP